MAKTLRGAAERVEVTAAASRASGDVVVEQQFHGVAYTSAARDERYALVIEGEFEMPLISGARVGDTVYIGTTDFTMARVATGASAPTISGNATVRPFAKVTRIPATGDLEPAAGLMWVKMLPQPA